MASSKPSSNMTSTDSATSQGFPLRKLALEIREMIYDEVHQQEDVKTIGNQLIVRYTPSPARFQRVGKEFAAEINRRTPRNQVHRLEITQKKLIFLPEDQNHNLPKRMLPNATDGVVVMNFNINDFSEGAAQERVDKLFEWIDDFVHEWNWGRELSAASTEIALPVTIRLWICSMDIFDDFSTTLGSTLGLMWACHSSFYDLSKIEIMFYKRDDHITYPNEAAVAGAKTLQVSTTEAGAGGWKLDDEAIRLAREVAKGRLYNKVDPEATDWWDKGYADEEEDGLEGEDQGEYSDEESFEGNEYSDEESEESDA